jgi:hypothetical protein
MPNASKKTQVKTLRREYTTLKRAYHKAGRAALGKPSGSKAKRDYQEIKREMTLVGSRLGRLTGIHKGR